MKERKNWTHLLKPPCRLVLAKRVIDHTLHLKKKKVKIYHTSTKLYDLQQMRQHVCPAGVERLQLPFLTDTSQVQWLGTRLLAVCGNLSISEILKWKILNTRTHLGSQWVFRCAPMTVVTELLHNCHHCSYANLVIFLWLQFSFVHWV